MLLETAMVPLFLTIFENLELELELEGRTRSLSWETFFFQFFNRDVTILAMFFLEGENG